MPVAPRRAAVSAYRTSAAVSSPRRARPRISPLVDGRAEPEEDGLVDERLEPVAGDDGGHEMDRVGPDVDRRADDGAGREGRVGGRLRRDVVRRGCRRDQRRLDEGTSALGVGSWIVRRGASWPMSRTWRLPTPAWGPPWPAWPPSPACGPPRACGSMRVCGLPRACGSWPVWRPSWPACRSSRAWWSLPWPPRASPGIACVPWSSFVRRPASAPRLVVAPGVAAACCGGHWLRGGCGLAAS